MPPISRKAPPNPSGDVLIRLPEVQHRTGLSKSEIYRRMKSRRFPRARKISTRIAAWSKSEIEAWIVFQLDPELDDLL